MKELLEDTYKDIPARAERIRMKTRLEDTLRNSRTLLGARKAMARLLLQNPGLKGLYDINHVPKEDGPLPRDPEEFVNNAVSSCGLNKEKKKLIEEKLKEKLVELKSTPPGKYDDSYYLLKDLERIQKSAGSIKYKITLLFLIREHGFLKDIGCLS